MLKLLFEIDDLCRANDLQYMLFAGAQLGVDRHGGLIPWDDDIDIIMTLENYDRFLEVAGRGLPPGRTLNALEKSTDYILTYGHYVDLNTTALQRHTVFGGIDPGVKIDVFFAVPTSEDPELAEEHRLRILAFNELVTNCAVMKYRRPESFFPFYREEKDLYEKLGRRDYITRRLPALKYQYVKPGSAPARYVLFSGMLSNSYLFDAEQLEHVQDTNAFGHPVMAAADGEYFDELLYGESWYQIPANYKKPHHSWGVVLSQPFEPYLARLRERIDLTEAHEAVMARKQYGLEQQIRYKDCFIERTALKNLAAGLSADHTVADVMRAGAGAPDPKELSRKLRPFFEAQLSADSLWYQMAIPVSAASAEAAAECLLRCGEYPQARKVIELQKLHGQLDEGSASRLLSQADYCKSMTLAVYKQAPQTAAELAGTISGIIHSDSASAFPSYPNAVFGNAPDTAITAEAGGRLLLLQSREAGGAEKEPLLHNLLRYTEDAISRYGGTGELWALKALALHELDAGGSAFTEALQMAAETVTNGFVLQELLDLGADLYAPGTAPAEPWDAADLLPFILECANRQTDLPLFPGKTICGAVYAADGQFRKTLTLPEKTRIELLVSGSRCDDLADILTREMPDYDIQLRQNKNGRFITVSDPHRIGTTVNAVVNGQRRMIPYRIIIRTTDAELASGGSIAYKGVKLDLPADEEAWLKAIGIDKRPIGAPVPAFPIYAYNVGVKEYLDAAAKEGLLADEKVSLFKEYRENRKNYWDKPTSIFNSLYNEIINICQFTEN